MSLFAAVENDVSKGRNPVSLYIFVQLVKFVVNIHISTSRDKSLLQNYLAQPKTTYSSGETPSNFSALSISFKFS